MASTSAFRGTLRAGAPALRAGRPSATVPRRFVQQQARRSYATSPAGGTSGGSAVSGTNVIAAVGILGAAGLGFYFYNQDGKKDALNVGVGRGANKLAGAKDRVTQQGVGSKEDYQEVYNAIAAELEKDENYDDGNFGPVLVRLAWHASGTYCKDSKTGGSNGATMRFAPEADHGANAGLIHARKFMDEIKAKHSWITYSDLWTLGGVCAVQEMGGPKVPWRPGRKDGEVSHCTPDGRLPDGDKGPDHLRFIFNRMGFNDQEIVALSGAHALGRCHPDRSGFEGPWTFSPTSFTNEYYNLLLTEPWVLKKWNGPKQYVDKKTGSLMMLTTDMALVEDSSFKKHVQRYAKNEDEFFKDFSAVYQKLLELGVPTENFKAFEVSKDGGKPYLFSTSAELENSQ